MNIFFLHFKTRRCARWHCDKHVVKMIVETCQLLYTCHWMIEGTPDFSNAPFKKNSDVRGYKKTHWNHPCAKWVRQSSQHYIWLVSLGKELLREYTFRFTKMNHACSPHIEWLYQNIPNGLTDNGWIPPPMAMDEEYKTIDVSLAYKRYYIGAKKDILHYTKRHTPHWLTTYCS